MQIDYDRLKNYLLAAEAAQIASITSSEKLQALRRRHLEAERLLGKHEKWPGEKDEKELARLREAASSAREVWQRAQEQHTINSKKRGSLTRTTSRLVEYARDVGPLPRDLVSEFFSFDVITEMLDRSATEERRNTIAERQG